MGQPSLVENTTRRHEPHPDYLTVRDVMASLNVSRDTVYRLLAKGELAHVYVGTRSIRIRRDAYIQWRREQEEKSVRKGPVAADPARKSSSPHKENCSDDSR
jgi:excisionase family DNA binding protein